MNIIVNTSEKIILRLVINETLANTIRRSLSEVPTLAVDEVEIFKNDSALYDEIIAHRIGLVPLKTEKGMSEKTKVDLKLSKTGPCTVYSGDLNGNADVVFDMIPITILGENHKLELVATAILGKGTEHAKFIPGLAYYRHILEVKSSPEIDKLIEGYKGAIKPEKKGSKWFCDLSDNIAGQIETIDKEGIKDSDELLFIVESYGNMPAKDILLKTLDAIDENLDEFEKAVK